MSKACAVRAPKGPLKRSSNQGTSLASTRTTGSYPFGNSGPLVKHSLVDAGAVLADSSLPACTNLLALFGPCPLRTTWKAQQSGLARSILPLQLLSLFAQLRATSIAWRTMSSGLA